MNFKSRHASERCRWYEYRKTEGAEYDKPYSGFGSVSFIITFPSEDAASNAASDYIKALGDNEFEERELYPGQNAYFSPDGSYLVVVDVDGDEIYFEVQDATYYQ